MKFNVIFLLCFLTLSLPTYAQSKPGKFSHLSKYSGSWDVEIIYKDAELRSLLSKEFYLDLDKFRIDNEDEYSQIDVIKGNMIIESRSSQNFCISSSFMSISLTNDDEIYLITVRNSKISIYHTIFGQRTRNIKDIRLTKETTKFIKSIIKDCKNKSVQNI